MTKPQRRLWGVTVARILDLLEQLGPMTQAEICKMLGLSRQNVSSTLCRLTKPVINPAPGPKRVYICDYTLDEEGQRRYPRPIYALGNKPNARKPKLATSTEVRRINRENLKKRRMVTVFNLGGLQ